MKIVVVGAGISGLSFSFYLKKFLERERKTNISLCIYEASPQAGGIIQTELKEGFILEKGPDSVLTEKKAFLDLVDELDLRDEIIGTNTENRQSFLLKNERLFSLPKGFYLIAPLKISYLFQTSFLSFKTKVRMALELFIPKKTADGDESVASFVRRRFGEGALNEIAQPMIGGIYTADPERLSLQATFPKFLDFEKKYGSVVRGLAHSKKGEAFASGPRYGLFVSLRKGMGSLIEKLLERTGEACFFNQALQSIIKKNEKWELQFEGKVVEDVDLLVLALPTHVSARIVNRQDQELSSLLSDISYATAATINFAFKRSQIKHSLDGFGFVVPHQENKTLIACSFSSVKYPNRAPDGHVLLRAFVGGALNQDVFDLTKEEIINKVLIELRAILEISGEPLFYTYHKWKEAMPQYYIRHLEKVAAIKSKVQDSTNLYLLSNAFYGVGIPDVIREAKDLAKQVVKQVQSFPQETGVQND